MTGDIEPVDFFRIFTLAPSESGEIRAEVYRNTGDQVGVDWNGLARVSMEGRADRCEH